MENLKKNRATILLLSVYLILLFFSGYLTFIYEFYNPGVDVEVFVPIDSVTDPEIKKSLIENLIIETDSYRKTKELAVTSFHMILGAFIGFLSTIAISSKESKTSSTK